MTIAFADLVANQSPKTFRDFLLCAPYMFLELGEKLGAISHIVSFWRYRFPAGAPPNDRRRRTGRHLPGLLQRLRRKDRGTKPPWSRSRKVIDTTAALTIRELLASPRLWNFGSAPRLRRDSAS